MRTPKQIFDEELSGEPLTEGSVIEVLKMYWNEAIMNAANNVEMKSEPACILSYCGCPDWSVDLNSILKLKIK